MKLGPQANAELSQSGGAATVLNPLDRAESVVVQAKEAGVKLEVKPWDFLSSIAKDAARGWFVKRAEDKGIAWSESVDKLVSQQSDLDTIFAKICDPSLKYPSYYVQPFHGYDDGNLSWKAAHELEAATQSMCLGYYDGISWQQAQEMFRGAARDAMAEYWTLSHSDPSPAAAPSTLLDVGCSGGFSTHEMTRAFPGVEAMGIDLSPHYLAVAQHTYPELSFVHGLAERTGLPDASFDVVTLNFLLHELPLAATQEVLKEAYRVLKPGGMIAVLDVDPRRLLELPPFRRWAFQVTEPWCKDGEYYALELEQELQKLGFTACQHMSNDPVNALTLATKR
jgi:ubiquinone/menaquinone biosynthesis C-methylase UbiE